MKKVGASGYGIGGAMLIAFSLILSSPNFQFSAFPFSNHLATLLVVLGVCLGIQMIVLDVREIMGLKKELKELQKEKEGKLQEKVA